MVTCYVIDDESHAVETLCDIIDRSPGLELVGHTTNPLIGLDYITNQYPPDLTFVDINMPEMSGIEFATLVGQLTAIIFTTAYENFAVTAFEKNAFDYLLKPVTQERFLKCITKYKSQQHEPGRQKNYFYIKGDAKGKIIKIITDQITYVEGALNYVIIHLIDGQTQITYLTMSEMEGYLPQDSFTRIHKSFIVNNDKIKLIYGNNITLIDKTIITIGNSYKTAFFEKLEGRTLKTKRIL